SFYLFYIGNNGLSGFNFGPSQFQNLLFLAGYDPSQPPFTLGCSDGDCVLPFLGEVRDTVSFSWLGVDHPSQWQAGVALYIMGLITYQCTLTFWTAAFPGLVRDLTEVKESLAQVKHGAKSPEAHAKLTSLSRNRVSNISFTVQSVGECNNDER
ncbi:hypothetical protein EV360DRAFT_45510, partial [Lentinula raphanica]